MQSNLFCFSDLQLPQKFTLITPYSIELHKSLLNYSKRASGRDYVPNGDFDILKENNRKDTKEDVMEDVKGNVEENIKESVKDGANENPTFANGTHVHNDLNSSKRANSLNDCIFACSVNNSKQLWVWGDDPSIQHIVNEHKKSFQSSFSLQVETFHEKQHIPFALLSLKCFLYNEFSKRYSVYYNFVNLYNNLGFDMNMYHRDGKIFACIEVIELNFGNDTTDSVENTMSKEDLAGNQLDGPWVLTPFGLPGKVVQANDEYFHVRITFQKEFFVFKKSQVRIINHKSGMDKNSKIIKKISKLLQLDESIIRSRAESRKRKRSHSQVDLQSRSHSGLDMNAAKKVKTCRDVYDTFTLNDEVVKPTSPPTFPTEETKNIRTFISRVESPSSNSVDSITPRPIPDFSEPVEDQIIAIKSYFPEYSGIVPVTRGLDIDESYLENDSAERDGELEDDFDRLWDEGSNSKSENDVDGNSSEADDQAQKQKQEEQQYIRRQILDFYGEQSRNAADSFVASIGEDSLLHDEFKICNPERKIPQDSPIISTPSIHNETFCNIVNLREKSSDFNLFELPEVFKSKHPPINSDNLLFASVAYLPNNPLNAGSERYCTVKQYIESIHRASVSTNDNNQYKTGISRKNFIEKVSTNTCIEYNSSEPTALETMYIINKLQGRGRRSSPTRISFLLSKLSALEQCKQYTENCFLPLFGGFDIDNSFPQIEYTLNDSYNLDMALLCAIQALKLEDFSPISADKLLSVLAEVKIALHDISNYILLSGPLEFEKSFVSTSNISFPQTPQIRLGFHDHWLDTRPDFMYSWERYILQPYSSRKRLRYLFVTHNSDIEFNRYISLVLRDLSSMFRLCHFGYHTPIRSSESDSFNDGIFQLDLSSLKRDSGNSLKSSFITAFQTKIREFIDSLKDFIGDAAEADETIVIYLLNPLPELLTRIISQSLSFEIPNSKNPIIFHVLKEKKLRSIYDSHTSDKLKDLALEVYNNCRSFKKWQNTRSPYFERMYEPAYTLTPQTQNLPNDSLYQHFDSAILQHPSTKMTIHFAYTLYNSKYIICTWTDSLGQILESAILQSSFKWRIEAWKRTLEFLQESPENVSWTLIICKYGDTVQSDELMEWNAITRISEEFVQSISIVSIELDSPLQILLDNSRIRGDIQNNFRGTVIIVPNSMGMDIDEFLNRNSSKLSECIVFSSLSVIPFEAKEYQSLLMKMQKFQSFVVTLHNDYNTTGLERNRNEAVREIGEEMFRLSWLNSTPSTPQRTSILPVHIQSIRCIEKMLKKYFQ